MEDFYQANLQGELYASQLQVGDTFHGSRNDSPYRTGTLCDRGWQHGYLNALPSIVTDREGKIVRIE